MDYFTLGLIVGILLVLFLYANIYRLFSVGKTYIPQVNKELGDATVGQIRAEFKREVFSKAGNILLVIFILFVISGATIFVSVVIWPVLIVVLFSFYLISKVTEKW